MSLSAEKEIISFPSVDGVSVIRACLWKKAETGADMPKGIVQIAHGMAEYIDRYDHFARFLVDWGYLVCGTDWIGHGFNVENPANVGVLPSNADDAFVGDFHNLRRKMQADFPDLPYFVLGHSMGSFVSRIYISKFGEGLSGVVLSGTAQQPAMVSSAGYVLARLLGKVKGEDYRSALLDSMGVGAYGKQISQARTPLDWLNTDDAQVAAYKDDPYCGSMFSVGGYAALLRMTKEMSSPKRVRSIPSNLPVLFIAGSQDPVGDCGKGVAAAAAQMKQVGMGSVQVKIYEGMRHEVLNHPEKETVYGDVLAWLDERIS